MERDALISEIDEYARRAGATHIAVCHRAVKNGHLFKRLKDGGDCSTGVARRLRQFMAENPPETWRAPRAAEPATVEGAA